MGSKPRVTLGELPVFSESHQTHRQRDMSAGDHWPHCKKSKYATWMRADCYYGRSSSSAPPPPLLYLSFYSNSWCLSALYLQISHSLTSILPFHVASLFKYDMNSIHSMQEGSVPIMCVWLSFGCCKQAREMWMRLTLPDWLSVLAPGYKHAFLVIYRCGVVSHEASG